MAVCGSACVCAWIYDHGSTARDMWQVVWVCVCVCHNSSFPPSDAWINHGVFCYVDGMFCPCHSSVLSKSQTMCLYLTWCECVQTCCLVRGFTRLALHTGTDFQMDSRAKDACMRATFKVHARHNVSCKQLTDVECLLWTLCGKNTAVE